MKQQKLSLLRLALAAGIILLQVNAWAQDGERGRRLAAAERRVAAEKVRPAAELRKPERIQNPAPVPGRLQAPTQAQNPLSRNADKLQNPQRLPQRPEEARGRAGEKVRQADVNHDGALSREEAGANPRMSRHFDEMDTNRDGVVSPEEMRAFREKRRQQRLDNGNGDPRF